MYLVLGLKKKGTLCLSALLDQLTCPTLIFLEFKLPDPRGMSSVPLATGDYQNITLCSAANLRHANRVYLTACWHLKALLCETPSTVRQTRSTLPPAFHLPPRPAQSALLMISPGD